MGWNYGNMVEGEFGWKATKIMTILMILNGSTNNQIIKKLFLPKIFMQETFQKLFCLESTFIHGIGHWFSW